MILKLNKINDLTCFDKKTCENLGFLLFLKICQKPKKSAVFGVFQNKNFFDFFSTGKTKIKLVCRLKKKGVAAVPSRRRCCPLLTYSTLLLVRHILSVSLFLRLRAFFCGAGKKGVFLGKTNRRARRCTTPPRFVHTHTATCFFLSLSFKKKMRLSVKNGRNPPFFDCKKGVNFILFLLTDASFFRTMKISRGEKNPTTESVRTKKE
ncbi:MAG: hypothetical protein KH349_06535 [Clostridium sp.]|nr:hypothetical protein [Clostridium sp.]